MTIQDIVWLIVHFPHLNCTSECWGEKGRTGNETILYVFKPFFVLFFFHTIFSSEATPRRQALLSAQTAPPLCFLSSPSQGHFFTCCCHGHHIKGQIRVGQTMTSCQKHRGERVIKRCPVSVFYLTICT